MILKLEIISLAIALAFTLPMGTYFLRACFMHHLHSLEARITKVMKEYKKRVKDAMIKLCLNYL